MSIEYFDDANGPQVLTSVPYDQASLIGSDPDAGPWWSGFDSVASFYDIGFMGGGVTRAYRRLPRSVTGRWRHCSSKIPTVGT